MASAVQSDRFVIYDKPVKGPAAHALVIGVGEYPHLLGGSGRRYRGHHGMRQLSSSPPSACAMADWLVHTYHNPYKPLATAALLVSGARHSDLGSMSERATIANVETAIRDWMARGDRNEKNLLFFYFCGHAISKEPDLSLLMEDFGSSEQNPLDGAVDFRELHLGLAGCAARYQIFILDACRKVSTALLDSSKFAGKVIRYGTVLGRPRHAPVFYSTVAGDWAYGRQNTVSVYTEALLKALNSSADDNGPHQGWIVQTDTLNRGVQFLLERAAKRNSQPVQTSAVDHLTKFPLHLLSGEPSVPVTLGCHPEAATPHAVLSYTDPTNVNVVRPRPLAEEWELDLLTGPYVFEARFPQRNWRDAGQSAFVRPPYREVRLDVS